LQYFKKELNHIQIKLFDIIQSKIQDHYGLQRKDNYFQKIFQIVNIVDQVVHLFEFQVLPQLLYYLKIDNMDQDSLDWGTLVVYTCRNSCESKNNEAYLNEFIYRQAP